MSAGIRMVRPRLTRFLRAVWFVAFLVMGHGCVAMYSYRTIDVQVVDAETGHPLPDAEIWVVHGRKLTPINRPDRVNTRTDKHGVAVLRIATLRPIKWVMSAEGYVDMVAWNDDIGEDLVPADFVRINGPATNQFRAPLYRKPRATIELVVANGYIGPIAVSLHRADGWLQGKPGVREFSLEVGDSGHASLMASPLLYRVGSSSPHFTVHRADGTPIPPLSAHADDQAAGWRLVYQDTPNHRILFFVGGVADWMPFESPRHRDIDHRP